MIRIDKDNRIFHLCSENYSYIFSICAGKAVHLHYGARLDDTEISSLRQFRNYSFSPLDHTDEGDIAWNNRPLELGEFGRGDFRSPSVMIEGDGFASTDYRFIKAERTHEHPSGDGLPVLRGGETLIVRYYDTISDTTLDMLYTVYPDALVRRIRLTAGQIPVTVKKLAAVSLDLTGEFLVTDLCGTYGMERNVQRLPLGCGKRTTATTRGASSHYVNPFIALSEYNATEENGSVYAVSLVYSGSFEMEAEADWRHAVRLVAGYNRDTFCLSLQPGESLVSPEAVLTFSDEGFGGMSRALHKTVRDYLLPDRFARMPRPIVMNSWEGTYFDFNAETLCVMMEQAAELGVDTFVIDDGWFGHRRDGTTSLGDWFVFEEKFPGGFGRVADKARACGLRLGLWFEPEMISEDSQLYAAHPDWVMQTGSRPPVKSRNQCSLDFSRSEIVDAIFVQMERMIATYDISYIKWDMNRNLCDMPDFTTQHRYMLGVYDLARRLTERFPELWMEGCSGGGGRFDLGMAAFFPQIWCSDHTDAYSRCFIQYGTSYPYPLALSSNHVTVPAPISGRTPPLKTRVDIAMLGTFGYELDPTELSQEEKKYLSGRTAEYRELQPMILTGDVYRLCDPFFGDAFCIQVVSENKRRSRITYMGFAVRGGAYSRRIYPKGLAADVRYGYDGRTFAGRTLMHAGIELPTLYHDYESVVIDLISVD